MYAKSIAFLVFVAALSGCASRPEPVAAVAPPPAYVAAPTRNLTGIVVPAQYDDGSFATPNRQVSAAGAVWHLRAGLNVAALGCRGAADGLLASEYNAMLVRHRRELATAQTRLSDERGGVAGFDEAMTRLYNYYAMPPAQAELCRAAAQILAESAMVPPGELEGFAVQALPRLDAPFVAVFAEANAARTNRFVDFAARDTATAVLPRLALDLSVLGTP